DAFPDAKTTQGCDRDGTQCARLQHETCDSDSGLRNTAASDADLRETCGLRSVPQKLLTVHWPPKRAAKPMRASRLAADKRFSHSLGHVRTLAALRSHAPKQPILLWEMR